MSRAAHGALWAGRLACAALLLALPRVAADAARREPLDNGAIVRLVMAGTPEATILARLAESPVDFDLSPGMVQELRNAGISERILDAMRRRQAEMSRPAPSATPVPISMGHLALDIVPDPEAKNPAERSVLAVREMPPRARRPGGMEVGEVSDLAVAILCTTPDHVPDHWEARTRLADAPRHELLFFQSGSAETRLKGFKVLYLAVAPELQIDLPEGFHDVMVAAAGQQVGSRAWRLLATTKARVQVENGTTTRLVLRTGSHLRGSSMRGYGLTLDWRLDSPGNPSGGVSPLTSPAPIPSPAPGAP